MNKQQPKYKGTMFEGGVSINDEFKNMRERGKKGWTIDPVSKELLESSIINETYENTFVVVNSGNYASQVDGNGCFSQDNDTGNGNLTPTEK